MRPVGYESHCIKLRVCLRWGGNGEEDCRHYIAITLGKLGGICFAAIAYGG